MNFDDLMKLPADKAKAAFEGQQAGEGARSLEHWEKEWLEFYSTNLNSVLTIKQSRDVEQFFREQIAAVRQKADATANFKGYMEGLENGKLVGRAAMKAEILATVEKLYHPTSEIGVAIRSLLSNNQQPK